MEWLAAHGDQLGVVGLCVAFVAALAGGWIYTKPQVRELIRQNETLRSDVTRWQNIALKGLQVGHAVVPVVENATHLIESFPQPRAAAGESEREEQA